MRYEHGFSSVAHGPQRIDSRKAIIFSQAFSGFFLAKTAFPKNLVTKLPLRRS